MHPDEATPAVGGDPTQFGASAMAGGPTVVDRLIGPLLAAALCALRRWEVR